MATQIVNGNRAFAQPGIDGGEFFAPNPVGNVLIISRMFRVESILVNAAASAGVFPSAAEVPAMRFNTLQSSGGFIASGGLVAGQAYDWIAVGLGG